MERKYGFATVFAIGIALGVAIGSRTVPPELGIVILIGVLAYIEFSTPMSR